MGSAVRRYRRRAPQQELLIGAVVLLTRFDNDFLASSLAAYACPCVLRDNASFGSFLNRVRIKAQDRLACSRFGSRIACKSSSLSDASLFGKLEKSDESVY